MKKNFKSLMSKHGRSDHKDLLSSLLELLDKKEGRCTLNLQTFLHL